MALLWMVVICWLSLDNTHGLRHNLESLSNVLKRPVVTLKIAFDQQGGVDDMSIDKSERFTSEASLDLVHRLRAVSDAVGVGVNTVIRDDPSLTIRRTVPVMPLQQPYRVVYDSKFKSRDSRIMKDEFNTIVFTDEKVTTSTKTIESHAKKDNMKEVKVGLTPVNACLSGKWLRSLKQPTVDSRPNNGDIDTSPATSKILSSLRVLYDEFNVKHFMLEGGPTLAKEFLKANCVDRAIIIRAPLTFHKPVMSGIDDHLLSSSPCDLELTGTYDLESDVITCWKRKGTTWPTENVASWP